MSANTLNVRVLTNRSSKGGGEPFLTVAIPHYKHRRYLEGVLASLFEQTYQDFEIVVSDDCSPDDSSAVIPALLEKSGRPFRYYSQPANLGYDGNVRFCLKSAAGRYILLLGNDDAASSPTALQDIARALHNLDFPEVAFTNYEDWGTHEVVHRAYATALLGSGPRVAVRHFRNFSFVSGLIYDRRAARQHETDRWDRSIYYQIYIACRILAAGGRLAALSISAVRKDVRVDGQAVPNNYVAMGAAAGWSFKPRQTGLDSVIRVTADAVLPLVPERERSRMLLHIVAPVFKYTYTFWLFEYRRIANWSASVGIARSMRPVRLLSEYKLKIHDRFYLYALYCVATMIGLLFPAAIFNQLRPKLSDFIRYKLQTKSTVEQ